MFMLAQGICSLLLFEHGDSSTLSRDEGESRVTGECTFLPLMDRGFRYFDYLLRL